MDTQIASGSGASGQITSGTVTDSGKQHLTISEAILQNSNFTHRSMRQLKNLL